MQTYLLALLGQVNEGVLPVRASPFTRLSRKKNLKKGINILVSSKYRAYI